MQDRVSLYPGRIKLTPVSGQNNVYDMERADQPTQEGTALNKANLLKDATAALYGLGTNAVPDDVFAEIYAKIAAGTKIATGSYVGTGNSGPSYPNNITLPFAPQLVWIYGVVSSGTVKRLTTTAEWYAPFVYADMLTTSYDRYRGFYTTNSWLNDGYAKKSADGKTISWYVNASGQPGGQANESGATYYYIAFA